MAGSLLAGAGDATLDLAGLRDGYLPYLGEAPKAWLAGHAAFEPDIVLCPWRGDAHQDHRLLGELAWQVFRDSLILEYEIAKFDGDLGRPNVFVELDEAAAGRKVQRDPRRIPEPAGPSLVQRRDPVGPPPAARRRGGRRQRLRRGVPRHQAQDLGRPLARPRHRPPRLHRHRARPRCCSTRVTRSSASTATCTRRARSGRRRRFPAIADVESICCDIRDVGARAAPRLRRGAPPRRAVQRSAGRPRRRPDDGDQPPGLGAARAAGQGRRRAALRVLVVVQQLRRGRATGCSTSPRSCGRSPRTAGPRC